MIKKRGKINKKKHLHKLNNLFNEESLFSFILFLMLGLLFISLHQGVLGIINWIIDFFTLLILYIIFIKIPDKLRNKKIQIFSKIIFVILLIIHFFIYYSNMIFLKDSIQMKYDLTSIKLSSISFFFTNIFPIKSVIIMLLIIGISILIIYKNNKINKIISKYFYVIFVILLILSSIILIFGIEYISNPYINYVINLQSNSSETIIIPKLPQENFNFSVYDKSNWSYENTKLDNKNVFIFVMEQTDLKEFNKEVKKIEFENNFFEQHLNNSHYYNNYYTPNQDSRTAIWAMLNSQFIPYECYINDWNKKYGVVLENNNLVEFFNYKNYSTIFASAVYEFNLILAIYNWTEINHLKSFDKDNEEFICIQTYQTQKGCEDKILLNDIEKTLKQQKHKKIFFIQELIFGHGQEYMSRSKLSRTEYYTKYFKDFYEMLKKNNLSENSTIIVVSDHGDKGYFNKKISNYNIPMIIIDKDLEYKEINKTYNQLDFKDLLLYYVSNKKMPEENKEIYFIGQTGSYEFGYLNTKTNENFIGNFDEKEKNYEYTLNYQNTNNRNLIKDKIKYLIDYRKFMEKESLMKDYGCKFCTQNIEKVKEKHED